MGFGTSFHLHDWLEELTRNLKKGIYPFPRVGSNLGNLIIAETSLIRYEPYNVLLKWSSFIFLMSWDYIEIWWIVKLEKQGRGEAGDGVSRSHSLDMAKGTSAVGNSVLLLFKLLNTSDVPSLMPCFFYKHLLLPGSHI